MNSKAKIALVIFVLILAGYYLFNKNIGTVNIPSTAENSEKNNSKQGEDVSYLKAPVGMKITYFAKDLPGARVIKIVNDGMMLVSQTEKGQITLISDKDHDGFAETKKVLLSKLNKPHGMEMSCDGLESCSLYIAEQDKISSYEAEYTEDGDSIIVGSGTKLIDLPSGTTDRHFTRSLLLLHSPDGEDGSDTLLISVGSSCDACNEKSDKQAKIMEYDPNTKTLDTFASGLRNSVFMATNPVNRKVFATEMGRDTLGDYIPPDEINIIEKGKNYGWPVCYGQNIHDTKYDKNVYIRNPCMAPFETPAFIDLQAHSAPLGLDFVPEEGWPENYWYNLLVAYHGSWNRSVPTGYKIVRLKIDAKGNYSGTEDFITGWLGANGKKYGRPVDIKILSGGTMYISDDLSGVIYRVSQI